MICWLLYKNVTFDRHMFDFVLYAYFLWLNEYFSNIGNQYF